MPSALLIEQWSENMREGKNGGQPSLGERVCAITAATLLSAKTNAHIHTFWRTAVLLANNKHHHHRLAPTRV